MKFTIDWLKEHLVTKFTDQKIIDKLTNIGLEVESINEAQAELSDFKIVKILKAEKDHKVEEFRQDLNINKTILEKKTQEKQETIDQLKNVEQEEKIVSKPEVKNKI